MSAIGKLAVCAAIVFCSALTFVASTAYANAPGGAYIQCDGGPSSPVRCTPDEW